MNVETLSDPNSIHKSKTKKNKQKFKKKTIFKKFDAEGFLYAWGFAIAFAVAGILIFFEVKTPEGASESIGNSNYQRFSGFHPESAKEVLALIAGSLLLLSAVYCIFLGLKIVAQFIVGKKLKFNKRFKPHFNKSRFNKQLSDKTFISE
ncbi:MAG: hypothetical protein Q8R96_14160 [Bacteroidota bacterium]|nr:hypothetical protein [Bacteroidota bacterium]